MRVSARSNAALLYIRGASRKARVRDVSLDELGGATERRLRRELD